MSEHPVSAKNRGHSLMGKIAYKIRNWKQYNRALVNRGNLTIWISADAVESWYAQQAPQGRGRPFTYSNACIELALTLRSLFQFPLRATQGFLEGLTKLMNLELKIPHYSCLSRRASDLDIQLAREKRSGKLDLVIDSTGLKVYGEGEWKMRTHGKQKRRTWRKYHVAVDPGTHEVVAMELTESNVHDCEVVSDLMKNLVNLGKIYGDGAYCLKPSLDAISNAGGHAIIPPRSGTCIVKKDPSPGQDQRNRLIRERRAAGGKKAWKQTSGYHRRSLVETHMFRHKTILGNKLHNLTLTNQITEARIRANILNRMTALGMPQSCKITQ
jgi:IS5 family transposase